MKPLEKRIEHLENVLLPKSLPRTGTPSYTWEDFTFLCHVRQAFPAPNTMPKFLEAEYLQFIAPFEAYYAKSLAEAPQSDEST
jgi:hypothetical protein